MARRRVAKAHAYGNDFLMTPAVAPEADLSDLARRWCDRHHGLGGDGLIVYTPAGRNAGMRLFNADGSPSELSGNGIRCLAALLARQHGLRPDAVVIIDTEAGPKRLTLTQAEGPRTTFRTAMGLPADVRQVSIPVLGETVTATVLRMGNPQCVVLGTLPDAARFQRFGPALATHPMFPSGTNVEFAQVEAPDRVRILIWERGVGPTTSSGTGSSAAAVAAAAHGGAGRTLEVVAPGGAQTVEWAGDDVYLTGWSELVFDGEWLGDVD
jgi:diaminopimelate epimerase